MSNYNKGTNFAVKDTLTSGDPDKVVSGAEIDNEFNSIASAVTSKADKVAAATTDNLAALDANGNLKDSGVAGEATVPAGGIIMWSGLISAIPTGWSLCDGTNTTPDLRDRFIVGAGSTYSRNDTGGTNSVTLTENQIPSHTHTMDSAGAHNHTATSTVNDPGHRHGAPCDNDGGKGGGAQFASDGEGRVRTNLVDSSTTGITVDTSLSSVSDHTHTINNTGGDGSHENRPPYFALAFIMKL